MPFIPHSCSHRECGEGSAGRQEIATMSMRGLAAGLVITLQCAGALSASAADLFQHPYDAPRAEAPGDDPRYRDVYKLPPPPYPAPRNGQRYEPAPRYAER